MTQPVTTTLSPDEWKNLALLNAGQLQSYLQNIPSRANDGVAGITDEHLSIIDAHLARGRSFLTAWRKSRAVDLQQPQAAQPAANGAAEPKKKGGWPLGKKRTRQQTTPVTQ